VIGRRVAFLALVLVAGCGRRAETQVPAAPAPATLSPAQLAFLKFARIAEGDPVDVADVPGTVDFDEERTARLAAPVSGRVAELLVRVGDEVAADQPLVAIDSPEVKAAQADWVRAEADERVARRAAERARRLEAARAIAEKDRLQAEEDARKAAADLERARAILERLRVAPGDRGSRYLVRAPFAGTVVERKALVGLEVSAEAADPLIVVSDLSRVRVVMRVPERQLALLAPGERVEIRVDAYPDPFPGEVTAVGDVVDDATRTVPARCTVPNPEHRLKPAMFARVDVKPPSDRRPLTVPVAALLSDGDGFRVIVRNPDGTLAPRSVAIGPEMNGRAEVVSGLAAGEEVVSEGALFAAQALARGGA